MNYPFVQKHSQNIRRFMSLAIVLVLMTALFAGCAKKDDDPTGTDAQNMPNIVDDTTPSSQETEPESVPETEPEKENVAIVKEQLNIRSSPSNGSVVTGQLDAGEEVEVLRVEKVNEVQWARIYAESINIKGWVPADLLDMTNVQSPTSDPNSTPGGEAATDPNAQTTTPTTPVNNSGNGTKGVVTATDLNIRSEASTTSDRVGGLTYGDRVTILETKNGWGRISQGWISMQYVYVDGEVGKNTCTGTVNTEELNVRSGPGTDYDKVSSLAKGAKVDVLEQIQVGKSTWGCIKGGWICMDFVSTNGSTNNNPQNNSTTGIGTATVTGNGLYIRSGAGTNYEVVGALKKGDTVTVLEKKEVDGLSWGRIEQGWICLEYTKMN